MTHSLNRRQPAELLRELVARRRLELEEHAARVDAGVLELERREEQLRDARLSLERVLRLGLQDLEAREADLARLERELADREQRLRREEEELSRRRRELGAVELKRAALEQRERAIADREAALEQAERERAEREAERTRVALLFVPGERYRLVACDPRPLVPGEAVIVEGRELVVARVGPSPLPRDRRRCAYLVVGPRSGEPEGGST